MAHEDEPVLGRPVQLCHEPQVSPASFRGNIGVTLATWVLRAKHSFIHVWTLLWSPLAWWVDPQGRCLTSLSLQHAPLSRRMHSSRRCVETRTDGLCWWLAGRVSWLFLLHSSPAVLSLSFPPSFLCPHTLTQPVCRGLTCLWPVALP